MFTQTKIPTLLGLFLVVIMIGAMAIGSEMYFRTTTAASGSIQPKQVRMTNISDTTFTVSWTTESPATGAISITSSSLPVQVIFDDQDTGGLPVTTTKKVALEPRLIHSATFRSGTPDIEYAITILSSGKKSIDGDKPYQVRTAGVLTTEIGNLEPAYGTIINEDNTPVSGALVSLVLDGSQILSTITKPSGTWLIPLNLIRTADLTSYLPITERMNVTITVRADGAETTAITDTLNDSPVPDMMMGKTYDFRRANAHVPGEQLALHTTPAPTKPATAVLGTSTAKPSNKVTLTIPAEGAAIPTTLPLIQGTGIPGKRVSLILGITTPVTGSTIVAADGLWSFTPQKPLAAGKQSVTITTPDINNKPVAITHMFEILKSGTQVLGDATPSATLTLTPTPSSTESATPTATPTESLEAEPPPISGNELPTIILLLLGAGLMLGGGVVLTFDRRTN